MNFGESGYQWVPCDVGVGAGARCLVLAALATLSSLSLGLQMMAQSAPNERKDPKLDFTLREVKRFVPQSHEIASGSESRASLLTTPSEILPASIRQAQQGRLLRLNNNGDVQAYIECSEIDSDLLLALKNIGATIELVGTTHPARDKGEVYSPVPTLQVWLPVGMIESAESLAAVRYIRLPDYGAGNTGSVDSQGDHILNANTVRLTYGVDGTGVRVGVVSSGIAGIFATGCTSCGATSDVPSPIVLEDLPTAIGIRNASGTLISTSGGITALRSFRSDADLEGLAYGTDAGEGTAMLEIVHDLAPGAQIYFTNADTSLHFEQAVAALAASTDVVVDDISWFTPPYDGTSAVSTNTAYALSNTSNPIRAYFTSAGNWAQNHYQGAFVDSKIDGATHTGESGELHLFESQTQPPITTDTNNLGSYPFDPVAEIPPGAQVTVYLSWDDPTGASSNDYDLFLIRLTCNGSLHGIPSPPCSLAGSAVASSENPQTGTQNPSEFLSWTNNDSAPATVGIVIQKINATGSQVFDVFVTGFGAKQSSPNHNFNTVSGSVPAEGDSGGQVVTLGAINQSQCPFPENCTGQVELYSSQGPTQTTKSTPSSLANRIKPDLIAVDQVCITGAGGFRSNDPASNCPPEQPTSYAPRSFGGTSAAAPHAAGVAALLLQMAPCYLSNAAVGTPATARSGIRSAITSNAQLLPGYPAPIPNSQVGSGLIDALAAASSLLPSATASSQSVSATSANGASVVLTGTGPTTGTNANICPIEAINWSGTCGTGSANGLHATVTCPIGVNSVQVGVSYNGVSFTPSAQIPISTVTVTDFALSVSPSTLNVQRGATLLYTVTASSTAQGAFQSAISLACSSGLPTGATCSFSPTTINPGLPANSPTSASVLTIYTSGVAKNGVSARPGMMNGPICLASGLVLIGIGLVRRKGIWLTLTRGCISLFLLTLMAGLANCGSHPSHMTPTTYSVTVTGTSNQLQHGASFSFTVQ